MKYNTINTIIDDIMLQMRRNNITESESYNRKQIEQWIIQYRAMFINQAIANNVKISSNYYQTFATQLEQVSLGDMGGTGVTIRRSQDKIPRPCLGSSSFKTIYSTDVFGQEIQIMSKKRSNANRTRRHFTNDRATAYIDSNRRYCIENDDSIGTAIITLIALNPSEVPGFNYDNDMYPIEPAELPEIKRLIFTNELKFSIIPDTENDGRDNMTIAAK